MKFSKGIVKNVNKRLLAGAFAATIIATGLTGCTGAVSIDDIKYKKDEKGYVQNIQENISVDTLKYCEIYKVYDQKEEKRFYTICLRDDFNGSYHVKYYDIFTGVELVYSDYRFLSVGSLDEYLVEDKTEYSEEELRGMLNSFVETKENQKQLVKEK